MSDDKLDENIQRYIDGEIDGNSLKSMLAIEGGPYIARSYLDGELNKRTAAGLAYALLERHDDVVSLAAGKMLLSAVEAAKGKAGTEPKKRQRAVWNTLGLSGVQGDDLVRNMFIAGAVQRLKEEGAPDPVGAIAQWVCLEKDTISRLHSKFKSSLIPPTMETAELLAILKR